MSEHRDRCSALTRRDFVKTSAAVVSTATLIRPNWAYAGASETIRVGLIGCGGRGTGAALQAINADPGVILTAMGDVFEDRLQSSIQHLEEHAPPGRIDVSEDRRFIGFDAYQQVIDSDVDAVVLATPPHFRPAHLKAAIEAGRHVFCEKPMAVDAPGVRTVREASESARQRNLVLVSGFCWRYSLPERATYRKIHEGAIGDVVSTHTTYHTSPLRTYPRESTWSDMEWQMRNWWHFAWLSGDHIVEQACHSIDKINWAMNGRMPVRAEALGGRIARSESEHGNVYDHFTVIYDYGDGVRAFHTCRQVSSCSNDNSDYITGTKGFCTVNGWSGTQHITGENNWDYEGERGNMYQIEHDEFIRSIRHGEPINDGQWMADSTMMAIMGRQAAYTGRTVTWEEIEQDETRLGPELYAFGDLDVAPVPIPGT